MRASALLLPIAALTALLAPLPATAGSCSVQGAAAAATVVELYTSEGCSSCPPADRWLSSLTGRRDVVALAFHVDYWDGLGWRDRFARPEFTQRQRERMHASGARVVYTPQVVVNGVDWRRWPELPHAAPTAGPLRSLRRDGTRVTVEIGPAAGAVSGFWAVLEDGHASRVRAGENNGATLRHDHVVRRYEAVPPWPAGTPRTYQLELAPGERQQRVAFVLVDPATQRPRQALMLDC